MRFAVRVPWELMALGKSLHTTHPPSTRRSEYYYINMQRIMLTLSDDEWETLRRLSFERKTPMTKLVREAIDLAYNTTDDIPQPGRQPYKEA